MKIEGKTVLVTGGVSGLGEATSIALSKKGGNVVMLDINKERGERLAKQLGCAQFIETDITITAQVKNAIDVACRKIWQYRYIGQLCRHSSRGEACR